MGMLEGVSLAKLKRIENVKGEVLHALKSTDSSYQAFGEAYFSFVNYQSIKGWKKHLQMTLNLIVPIGNIRFVLFDDRKDSFTYKQFMEVSIGEKNYCRLTIPPGIFVAFQGQNEKRNVLLNIASIPHDPFESTNLELYELVYLW
jgi:dTDP-4-dehydrorhamnose 3,5-epimerase